MRRGARGTGRVAPLRGLRALPVYAGGDEERDADAVRHRLPAARTREPARRRSTTLRLECVALPEAARGRAEPSASCRPRASATRRAERRLERRPGPRCRAPRARPRRAAASPFDSHGERRTRPHERRARRPLRVRIADQGASTTDLAAGVGARPRWTAAPRSATALLSAHAVLGGRRRGRFVSPLENDGAAGAAVAGCENVNTFPVLASPDDRAVLGAAIVLPDHPRIAPESLGNLFDNTEIEEALLLHVQTPDRRRARGDRRAGPGGAGDDRARARRRAEDILRLHG